MNETRLLYQGNVKVKLKIKDKVLTVENHNHGLPALQRAFCNFITGNSLTIEDIPQYMDIRYSVNEDGPFNKENTILLNKLPLTGKSWDESQYIDASSDNESSYVAKLTAVLSSNSLINKISSNDQRYFRIYLISGSVGQTLEGEISGLYDMAYLNISAETLSMVGPGAQAIIEWSLRLLTGGNE